MPLAAMGYLAIGNALFQAKEKADLADIRLNTPCFVLPDLLIRSEIAQPFSAILPYPAVSPQNPQRPLSDCR